MGNKWSLLTWWGQGFYGWQLYILLCDSVLTYYFYVLGLNNFLLEKSRHCLIDFLPALCIQGPTIYLFNHFIYCVYSYCSLFV